MAVMYRVVSHTEGHEHYSVEYDAFPGPEDVIELMGVLSRGRTAVRSFRCRVDHRSQFRVWCGTAQTKIAFRHPR